MATMVRRSVLAALVAAVALAGCPEAKAGEKVWPPSGGEVPRLGFCSHFNGWGERVTWVQPGTLAEEIGLERADVILAVNGYRLNYDGAWYDAMARAAAGGHVRLAIRDCRTGQVVYRHFTLGNYFGSMKAPRP